MPLLEFIDPTVLVSTGIPRKMLAPFSREQKQPVENGIQGTLGTAVYSSLDPHEAFRLIYRTLPVFRALACS